MVLALDTGQATQTLRHPFPQQSARGSSHWISSFKSFDTVDCGIQPVNTCSTYPWRLLSGEPSPTCKYSVKDVDVVKQNLCACMSASVCVCVSVRAMYNVLSTKQA